MFKHFVVASVVVAGLASGTPSFAASDTVAVSIQPAASMDLVLHVAGRVDQLLATTDRAGRATFSTDLANIVKGRRFNAHKCGNRVVLVADRTQAPANCEKKKLAAYAWGEDETLTVKLSGAGLSGQTKTLMAAAAGAGAYIAKEKLGGGAHSMQQVEQQRQQEEVVVPKPAEQTEQPRTEPVSPVTEQPKPEDPKLPDPVQSDLTRFNGVATGNLMAIQNDWNYNPNAPVRLELTVDKSGFGILKITHTVAGVTFSYFVAVPNGVGQTAKVSGEASQQVGSTPVVSQIFVDIASNTATVRQELRSQSRQGAVIYTGQVVFSR